MNAAPDWDCDAYGPEGRELRVLCFFASRLGERVCPSLDACREAMTGERQRLWQRMQDLKAAGDPFWAGLADDFPTPDTLLGGGMNP